MPGNFVGEAAGASQLSSRCRVTALVRCGKVMLGAAYEKLVCMALRMSPRFAIQNRAPKIVFRYLYSKSLQTRPDCAHGYIRRGASQRVESPSLGPIWALASAPLARRSRRVACQNQLSPSGLIRSKWFLTSSFCSGDGGRLCQLWSAHLLSGRINLFRL